MERMKVSELMTRSVVTLSPDETLAQAAATLASLNVSGAPVCDAEQRLVGVFSKSDLVSRLIDGRVDPAASVGEHMTTAAITLGPDDDIRKATDVMAERSIHRLVVVDAEGHVVGILSPLDILKAVHAGRLVLNVPAA
jgi:predicted transcriptional regulator